MPTYEQKLSEFAQGRKFARLARPLRDRADALCDACGSTQPRTLFALRDRDSGRCYFVGDTCLKELAKRGVILKTFSKQSAQQAYDEEARHRVCELNKQETVTESDGTINESRSPASKSSADNAAPTPSVDGRPLIPTILIIETPEECQAVVSIFSAGGNLCSWGCAKESRSEEVWQKRGERALVLEKVKQERPRALALCLARAWQEAWSRQEGSEQVPPLSENSGDGQQLELTSLLLTLRGQASTAYAGRYPDPALIHHSRMSSSITVPSR